MCKCSVFCRHVQKYGPCKWGEIAKEIRGRPRNGKSCRLRWCNQLNPAVKKSPFSDLEDAIIVTAHQVSNSVAFLTSESSEMNEKQIL